MQAIRISISSDLCGSDVLSAFDDLCGSDILSAFELARGFYRPVTTTSTGELQQILEVLVEHRLRSTGYTVWKAQPEQHSGL